MTKFPAMPLDGSEPCRGMTWAFFPDRTNHADAAEKIKLAKQICATCQPAKRLWCSVQGHSNRETDGVWGGTDLYPIYNLASRERQQRQRARRNAQSVIGSVQRCIEPAATTETA